jgi:guanylate kinase
VNLNRGPCGTTLMEKKRKGLLFVVSAPSGTGKTTLCRAMLKSFPGLHFSVSYTTRPPRPGDEDGRDYHFVSPEEFQKMIDRGDFAEWAEVFGRRYGTSRVILDRNREEGRDTLLDIDVQGARQMQDMNCPGIFIFILPPSLAELRRRLSGRKTEAPEALEGRLEKARDEIAEARRYDYWIINDNLKKARERLGAIILAEQCRRERMAWFLETLMYEKEGANS